MAVTKTRESAPSYSSSFLLGMYQRMVLIRRFEEQAAESFTKGMLAGNIHLCIGQEASCVGACTALESRDFMTSTHRGHGHCLARGARPDRTMAELFGKATGYCGGKGGSMHIVDVSLGILGANGIVGAGIPIATGSGLVSSIQGTDEVTLCFFGDAASNQGTFHESINMAAAWNLPVIYFCENNQYGVSVPIRSVMNTDTVAERAKAYNIPGITIDGNDPIAVYETVRQAVDRARKGEGPTLIEALTYRHMGHYMGDNAWYRPESYMEEATERDCLANFRARLLGEGISEADITAAEQAAKKEIEEAYVFADESPYPDISAVTEDMYSQMNDRCVAR